MTLQTTRGPAPHGGRPVLAAGAPAAEAAGAMILLHGRGGSADDILSLAPTSPISRPRPPAMSGIPSASCSRAG